MRTLRPGAVFALGAGVWVVDELQPVAVVLDPGAGTQRTVSWRELPPAPVRAWPPPQVLSDGGALWAQQEPSGPLVRIGPYGVEVAVWTAGRRLAGCGPGVAWCASLPRGQELVAGPDPHPVQRTGPDQLLRVDAAGAVTRVATSSRVVALRSAVDALEVEVEQPGWTLRPLGGQVSEVVRPTHLLRLPWADPVPAVLTVEQHGAGGQERGPAYDTPVEPSEQVLLTASRVDIGDGCWPLCSRPLDAGSYATQVLADHSGLDESWRSIGSTPSSGPRDMRTTLVGEWPDTLLQWTFRSAVRPGVLLRRRMRLYDELGRRDPPEFADVALMEDLDTGALPPTSDAA